MKIDQETKKATIKYDQNSVIQFPYNGSPVELRCEADSEIEKCQLTHQTENEPS